jgi:hypothetical protein
VAKPPARSTCSVDLLGRPGTATATEHVVTKSNFVPQGLQTVGKAVEQFPTSASYANFTGISSPCQVVLHHQPTIHSRSSRRLFCWVQVGSKSGPFEPGRECVFDRAWNGMIRTQSVRVCSRECVCGSGMERELLVCEGPDAGAAQQTSFLVQQTQPPVRRHALGMPEQPIGLFEQPRTSWPCDQ